jgi:hypothetical protein
LHALQLLVLYDKDTYWGANRYNFGGNKTMHTHDDAQVEGALVVYEATKDPWFGGSLDSYDGAM